MKTKEKLIVSPEDFKKLTCSQICELIRNNKNYRIEGEVLGEDRRIVSVK